MSKRPPATDSGNDMSRGKPTNAVSSPNVILLDFNGHYVSGTMWNTNGSFSCSPANLTSSEITNVFQRVTADYAPFNVTVTTDENVYNNANPYSRTRIIVTESWEWYGQTGGVALLNSFTWGDNTPCFVFSSLFGYNIKKIAEACSHEAGHTLGLRHQSLYDLNGIKLDDYNWGQGGGEIGWAPIMGAAYNQNLTLWHYGPNSVSATTMQDDVAKIASVVGLIADDYSNTSNGAALLGSSITGIINSSNDVDFFSLSVKNGSKTISLVPDNVGDNNEGGNLDLVLNIYNTQGSLLYTINDPMILNAGISLSKGSYYLSASTTDNQFTTKYGMLGRYTLSVF